MWQVLFMYITLTHYRSYLIQGYANDLQERVCHLPWKMFDTWLTCKLFQEEVSFKIRVHLICILSLKHSWSFLCIVSLSIQKAFLRLTKRYSPSTSETTLVDSHCCQRGIFRLIKCLQKYKIVWAPFHIPCYLNSDFLLHEMTFHL